MSKLTSLSEEILQILPSNRKWELYESGLDFFSTASVLVETKRTHVRDIDLAPTCVAHSAAATVAATSAKSASAKAVVHRASKTYSTATLGTARRTKARLSLAVLLSISKVQ